MFRLLCLSIVILCLACEPYVLVPIARRWGSTTERYNLNAGGTEQGKYVISVGSKLGIEWHFIHGNDGGAKDFQVGFANQNQAIENGARLSLRNGTNQTSFFMQCSQSCDTSIRISYFNTSLHDHISYDFNIQHEFHQITTFDLLRVSQPIVSILACFMQTWVEFTPYSSV